jgi:hypothetical protein
VRSSIASFVRRPCTADPASNDVKFSECCNSSSSLLSGFPRDSANSTALLSSSPAPSVMQRLPQCNSAAHADISECEMSSTLISDITRYDLAIISMQVI